MNLIKQTPHLHLDWIDPDAMDVVRRLQGAGFTAYLVGGCVRDLLAGQHPKDFDIATNASPQQVKKKIPFSFIIGKRFRLVLVKRGDKQFEVATFRRNMREEDVVEGDEVPFGDNFFGTTEEDAVRRDFTINALFYDPIHNELLDYVQGADDVKNKVLRMIGDPDARLKEDSIRILRAIRLAHKLHFTIEESLRKAILENAESLKTAVLPRKREEYLKILRLKESSRIWFKMYDLKILDHTIPYLKTLFDHHEQAEVFARYIDMTPRITQGHPDAIKEFTVLILAVIRALNTDTETWFKSEESSYFFQQIGIFKQEASIAHRTLYLLGTITDIEYYKKKGPRRQQAFVRQEVFPTTLRIAELEHLISPSEVLFWKKEYKKYHSKPQERAEPTEDTE